MKTAKCCENCCYNLKTMCRLNYREIKENSPVKWDCPLDWITELKNKKKRLLNDPDYLYQIYVVEKKKYKNILKLIGCYACELNAALDKFNIPKRRVRV